MEQITKLGGEDWYVIYLFTVFLLSMIAMVWASQKD